MLFRSLKYGYSYYHMLRIINLFKKPTKKEINREKTERIRQQGREGENFVKTKWQLRGYEVERTGKGHDFYVRKRDPLTNRVTDSKYVEVKNGENANVATASMSDMGAACVASAGSGLKQGSAASMTMYPVVPDYIKYPNTGRSLQDTYGEIGLAGHWIKLLLHYMFI